MQVVDRFVDGQRCDETGTGRKTDVSLECCEEFINANPYSNISGEGGVSKSEVKALGLLKSIVEEKICEYKMVVCVPAMCPQVEGGGSQGIVAGESSSRKKLREKFIELNVIMKAMELQMPCLLRREDWWTYELCVGKGIRQFHVHVEAMQGPNGAITQNR